MALDPQFTTTANLAWGAVTAANTAYDGTGTTVTLFTAPTTGSYVSFVKLKPLGTAALSVMRIFVNNGSVSSTASNNTLIAEVTLPAATAIQTAALLELSIPLQFALPSGYKILAAVGTATSWQATVVGGDF